VLFLTPLKRCFFKPVQHLFWTIYFSSRKEMTILLSCTAPFSKLCRKQNNYLPNSSIFNSLCLISFTSSALLLY
jgi:hypothetical protein